MRLHLAVSSLTGKREISHQSDMVIFNAVLSGVTCLGVFRESLLLQDWLLMPITPEEF